MNDSLIDGELRKRISHFQQKDKNTYTFQVCFDSDFAGFSGHFPENPIVPGICLLILTRIAAEEALQKNLS